MKTEEKIVSLLTALVIVAAFFLGTIFTKEDDSRVLKVGFIYVGDGATAYTKNYMNAQDIINETYGDKVECIAKYNVVEGQEAPFVQDLVDEGCEIIFGGSFGFGESMVNVARNYPNIQFCHATGVMAAIENPPDNYHTYMGHIYEGRYITGVICGMKLQEMVERNNITPDAAVIGYVAAFPYAEVISGYTAFYLGAKSVCPSVTMKVKYANTWSSYTIEKRLAEELLNEGCIIISQHSDTSGPAVACENFAKNRDVFHVAYNQSMLDVAPTTSIIGCRIDWAPYEVAAVGAVLNGKKIENALGNKVNVNGNDAGAGIAEGWVEMLELNDVIAPAGSKEAIERCIKGFASGRLDVFSGDFIGVDPFDALDKTDLSKTPFKENADSSAPSFHYILEDVITIE